VTSSWFFLSTLNYDARSTTYQIYVFLPLQSLTGSVELCATRGGIWNSSNCIQGAYVMKSMSKVILKAMTFPTLLTRQTERVSR